MYSPKIVNIQHDEKDSRDYAVIYRLFLSAYTQTPSVELELEQGMPEFYIVHDDGNRLTINPYLNKIILIVFFDMSSVTSLEELKSIERFIWPGYHENADFMLLPIGVGHTDKELGNYRKEHSIPFSLYPDEYGEILPKFTMKTALPRMYVVDNANKIVYISEGYEDTGYIKLERVLARTSNSEPIYTDPLQEEDDWNSLLYKLNN